MLIRLLIIIYSKFMLFNYYNRKSVGAIKKEQPQESQEDAILQSFYQERRSRSSNVKHHNLLKKNISFFHQEQQDIEQPVLREALTSHNLSYNNINSLSNQKNILTTSTKQMQIPTKTIPPLPKSNAYKQISNKTAQPNHQITIQKWQDPKQLSKQQLNKQLNKRISIKNYLTQMQQQNKQNKLDKHNNYIQIQNKKKKYEPEQLKLKYKYDSKISQAQENILMGELSRITSNSKDSRLVRQSKYSTNSLFQQNNNYQISKNNQKDLRQINQLDEIKYKYSQKSFSLKRNSLPTLGESRQLSCSSTSQLKKREFQCQKNVLMAQEELTYLDQNSHPLRDTTLRETTQRFYKAEPLQTKQTFFEPQKQSFYKKKIKDLQKQIDSLKGQHRRQQKFIQSIYKMRRLMLNSEEDCSLKQLWRWIKDLPSSSITPKKQK